MRAAIIYLIGIILMIINIRNKDDLKEFQGTFVEKNSMFLFGLVLIVSGALRILHRKYDFNFWLVLFISIIMLALAISLLKPMEIQKIYLNKYRKYISKKKPSA